MKKLAVGTLLATALVPVVGSCNSDSTTEYELSSSALVRSFSLASNDSILANLDSVFFSIDLYTGQIYNADSLPFGTRIQALTPTILTDGASVIELSVASGSRRYSNQLFVKYNRYCQLFERPSVRASFRSMAKPSISTV